MLPIVYVLIKYIIPPKFLGNILQVIDVGKVSEVPVNSAKIVKFNKIPIILVHTTEKQIKAYSAICTHLGCVVQYHDTEGNFQCHCHGSIFDMNGKNISGPAPKPLMPYRVELINNNILIYKS